MAGEKILFVDDEANIREVTRKLLSLAGYEVTTAASGEEALEALRRDEFALVLTDLKMPGMSGEEVLQRIKEITPATDVIIVTGYPTLESAIRTLKAGAYDYLLKPFELSDLERTVQCCLEKQRLTKDPGLERHPGQKVEELSRLKAGRLNVQGEKVDLKKLLTRVAERVRGKPLRFISDVDPTLGKINTDPSRLERILGNLLDNAVKFTPRGEIRLTAQRKGQVGAVHEPPAVEIAVCGAGIGTPWESQEMAFDEFRKLVRSLGGSIEMESVGEDSTFRVTLLLEENF